MKTLFGIILVAFLVAGCATGSKANKQAIPTAEPVTREAKISASLECLGIAEDARKKGSFAEEKIALDLALMYLRDAGAEDKNLLIESAEGIRSIISISGFEYAPKESLELFVAYMEMQNAYADRDGQKLAELRAAFLDKLETAKTATTSAKQKRIDALGKEVSAKKEEIKKQPEPETAANSMLAVYTVKKGDNLPSIAGKKDVYNDSFMWPLIYKANRDQIKDPKVLYGGQELKIPRDMSIDDIVQARREAGAPEPEKIPKDAIIPRRAK